MVSIVGVDQSAVRRTTCKSCASILEYTLTEVKNFTSYDYGGGSDINYYIECPKCNSKAYVKGY